jgi:hypothetical protein
MNILLSSKKTLPCQISARKLELSPPAIDGMFPIKTLAYAVFLIFFPSRTRKVKCEQGLAKDKCDACLLASKDCSFKARDQRFHNPEQPQGSVPGYPSQFESSKDVIQPEGQPATYGGTVPPSPPIQGSASRFGSFINVLKRPASAIERNSPEALEAEGK